MYTLHTRFCTFGADLHAQSVLINKISASEISRKFINSALLVGDCRKSVNQAEQTRYLLSPSYSSDWCQKKKKVFG